MTINNKVSLYDQVVKITDEYLGPAADRFVTRQIKNHLNKDPHELQAKDLKDLVNWINLAMTLLSGDDKLVHEYITDLKALARNKDRHQQNGQRA